ncbi:hypothetical protein POJ06DRAFT_118270 [Lipomyces tetrasporus]|uniref:Enoyl reductase (ER) domain-containing protein n=1 Tax=Lipomyces tetrasporus TaxID=54092 RepID=A0AAD7QQR7_9ASCO|nr:uncharacterized protein POJ06DRAFT_118270 [Lipomyces tetrasporus]KAJ8099852.1 hypothetical protein POJ06DRAFT_118270 [Lipomyces tetrasporus]
MSLENKTVMYKKVPVGLPTEETLGIVTSKISSSAPEGGLLIQVLDVSLDPYLRGRMRDPSVKSYTMAFAVNEPMYSYGIGRVVDSSAPEFAKGDIVKSPITQFALYQSVPKAAIQFFKKVENPNGFPLTYFLGVLGMPGLTAYYSFYKIGEPKKGETILISAASGAVGQLVGQLAKREGLRVVGSVGSDDKATYLRDELEFDTVWNYKKIAPAEAIAKHTPEGIDIYFDNVGGEFLDAALAGMNNYGRIIACGQISQYNVSKSEDKYGIKNTGLIVGRRLKLQGFIILDIYDRDEETVVEFEKNVSKCLKDGEIIYKEDVTEGIENTLNAFVGLLTGSNFGKVSVKVSE